MVFFSDDWGLWKAPSNKSKVLHTMEIIAMDSLAVSFLQSVINCQNLINSNGAFDVIIPRLESMCLFLQENPIAQSFSWKNTAIQILTLAIQELSNFDQFCANSNRKIEIPVENIEFLLSIKFKVVDIAKLYRVSRFTISRRLAESGLSVS